MQATTNNPCPSYSDLPIVCTRVICTHLARPHHAPLVCARGINQDFLRESRIPLAESIIGKLKAVDYRKFPAEEDRLRVFHTYLRYVKGESGLPHHVREAVLKELCRIVNTLPGQFFHAGWRDMVAQFRAEPDQMRAALQEDMNKAWGRVELYGDGGAGFEFNAPAQWKQ